MSGGGTASEDPAVARAAELAALGYGGPLDRAATDRAVVAVRDDPDPRVRAAALGALSRAAVPGEALTSCQHAARDAHEAVRRRAADLGPALAARDAAIAGPTAELLVGLLDDRDVTVTVAAASALGELGDSAIEAGGVSALAMVTTDHEDALAREAGVAALGALGDPNGLPAILRACADKPAVRRRAVLALAPFNSPDVDDALEAASTDRDWQVRQAAEDLLGHGAVPERPEEA